MRSPYSAQQLLRVASNVVRDGGCGWHAVRPASLAGQRHLDVQQRGVDAPRRLQVLLRSLPPHLGLCPRLRTDHMHLWSAKLAEVLTPRSGGARQGEILLVKHQQHWAGRDFQHGEEAWVEMVERAARVAHQQQHVAPLHHPPQLPPKAQPLLVPAELELAGAGKLLQLLLPLLKSLQLQGIQLCRIVGQTLPLGALRERRGTAWPPAHFRRCGYRQLPAAAIRRGDCGGPGTQRLRSFRMLRCTLGNCDRRSRAAPVGGTLRRPRVHVAAPARWLRPPVKFDFQLAAAGASLRPLALQVLLSAQRLGLAN
mmetsp:Transcript_16963/g.42568  ORF Transcript_16963/g.42568 Transcript_16963/m.42568 type:complete len:311 (-) Transcript_16963:221-1153(-)